MRSRSSDIDGSAGKHVSRHTKDHSFLDMKHTQQVKDPTSASEAFSPHPKSEKSQGGNGHQAEDLSRDDLLFLLSILEGELQVSWVEVISCMIQKEGSL